MDHEASTDPDSSSDPSSSAAAPAGSDELADSAGRTEQDLRSGGPGRIVLAATPIGNVGDASARLVELFEHAGLDRVVLGDEFGDHDIPKPLDFLRTEQAWAGRDDWPPIYGVRRLYAEDRSIIAIVPWDQFFTVIAMTAERAAQTAVELLFEGFWCDDATTLSWWRNPSRSLITPAD